MNSLTLLLLQS